MGRHRVRGRLHGKELDRASVPIEDGDDTHLRDKGNAEANAGRLAFDAPRTSTDSAAACTVVVLQQTRMISIAE